MTAPPVADTNATAAPLLHCGLIAAVVVLLVMSMAALRVDVTFNGDSVNTSVTDTVTTPAPDTYIAFSRIPLDNRSLQHSEHLFYELVLMFTLTTDCARRLDKEMRPGGDSQVEPMFQITLSL